MPCAPRACVLVVLLLGNALILCMVSQGDSVPCLGHPETSGCVSQMPACPMVQLVRWRPAGPVTEISKCAEGLHPFLPIVPLSRGREG